MHYLKKPALIVASSLIVLSFTLLSIRWNIDPDYSIKFSGTRAEGTFSGLSGKIVFEPARLAQSSFDVEVDVNTIRTGIKPKTSMPEEKTGLMLKPIQKSSSVHLPSKS